jgi:anti-sigma-K factor RskA
MSGRIEPSDYLLGELSASDRAEAERMLREDPAFRAQVDRLAPLVGTLSELPGEAWEVAEPPPREAPSAPTAPERPARGSRRRLLSIRPVVAAAACAALLAAGVGIGSLLGGGDEARVGTASALDLRPVSTLAANSRGTAQLDGAAERATLDLSGMPASRPGEYYELWLLEGPGELVSLGSFRVPDSGEARVDVPMPADPRLFKFVDISVERLDEGPEHSGLSVMRART